MNLDALLRVFYLDVYEFEVYDPFSRPQTCILRGIAVYIFLFRSRNMYFKNETRIRSSKLVEVMPPSKVFFYYGDESQIGLLYWAE